MPKHKNSSLHKRNMVVPKVPVTASKAQDASFFSTARGMQAVLLFLLAVLLYTNTVVFDYALDDKLYITKNEYTKKGVAGIPDILSNDLLTGFYGIKKDLVAGGRYRPLSQVTYALEWELFGENPHISHLVNILLYAFTGLLLFKVLNMLFVPPPVLSPHPLIPSPFGEGKRGWGLFGERWSGALNFPFIATAIFLVHPLHTEVVANIKGRDDLMCLLGSLGALYFTLKWLPANGGIQNHKFLLWACACFFLGILTKETTITFLGIIPVTAWFFTKHSIKRIGIAVLPLVMTAVIYILLRYAVLGPPGKGTIGELMNNPFTGASASQKFATISYTLGLYVKLLVYPHPLTHDYYPKQIPIIGWADIRALVPLAIYAALGMLALWGSIKKSVLSWCFWLFLLSFSIASNIVFNVGTFMNERFMYIPSIGFGVAAAYFLLKGFPKSPPLAFTLFLFLLLAFSIKTISRNFAWADDFTLALTDIKTSSNSAKCNMSAGGNLVEKAEKEENPTRKDSMLTAAVIYLDKATALHPTYNDAWLLKGNAFSLREEWNNALICYNNVLNISPNHEHAQKNLQYVANKTTEKQQYGITLKAYSILLKFHPDNADYLKKTGTFYGKNLGKIDSAIVYLSKAVQLNPKDGYAWQELGVANGITGRHKEALEYFLKAKELIPEDAGLYMNLALTYRFLGDTVSERAYREKSQQLDKASK